MTQFYTKFISIEEVIEELHTLDLSTEERMHLAGLIDSSLHHAILNEVLSHLKGEDKKLFLKLLAEQESHEKITEFLEIKVDNIQDKIKKVADELVAEMHKDIKEAKRAR